MIPYPIDSTRDERLTQLVHQVEDGDTVEVTRCGQIVAVMISAQEYDLLNESKKSFSESILRIRKKYRLDSRKPDESDMTDEEFDTFFDNLRDRSPGREVDL